MSVLYSAEPRPSGSGHIRLQLKLENRSGWTWPSGEGFAVSYQVFEPEYYTLIQEGRRTPFLNDVPPGQTGLVDLHIELPPEDGRFQVFISPIQEQSGWCYKSGWPFLVAEAEVSNGCASLLGLRTTSWRLFRAELFLRSLARGFKYPALSIWRNRSLIRSMVRRDILGRYRGSFAGLFWTVLNPILLMATYFFVFGVVLQTRFGNDPSRSGFVLYFLAGMLPWLAFSEAAGRAPFVILEHRNFVKKLVFPLETLPVNLVAAGAVTEAFALLVFLFGLLLARGYVPSSIFWLPILLIPQILFTLGLCWALAALGAYVRDLGQIIGFLLTLWFFLTPICYPVENLPPLAVPILSNNPIFLLVAGYRAIFLESRMPEAASLWKLWPVSLALFLAGHALFYKLRKHFADVI